MERRSFLKGIVASVVGTKAIAIDTDILKVQNAVPVKKKNTTLPLTIYDRGGFTASPCSTSCFGWSDVQY